MMCPVEILHYVIKIEQQGEIHCDMIFVLKIEDIFNTKRCCGIIVNKSQVSQIIGFIIKYNSYSRDTFFNLYS